MRRSITYLALFAPTIASAACCGAPDSGTEVGGTGGHVELDAGSAWSFDAPECWYDDDCNWRSPDGGSCVEGSCVPHPPGWCLVGATCPQPKSYLCGTAWCDGTASACRLFLDEVGAPCGARSPDGGVLRTCDSLGDCVDAHPPAPPGH